MYSPKIYPENIKRLHGIAKKMDMPMTKLVNLVISVAIEQLEMIEDWDDMIVYIPVRPEEPDRSEKDVSS